MPNVTITLSEGDRQLTLLALAKLSIERKGFDDALARIALQMDNDVGGRPQMYDNFRTIYGLPGAVRR